MLKERTSPKQLEQSFVQGKKRKIFKWFVHTSDRFKWDTPLHTYITYMLMQYTPFPCAAVHYEVVCYWPFERLFWIYLSSNVITERQQSIPYNY